MLRERSVIRGASAAEERSFTLTVKSFVFTVNWPLEAIHLSPVNRQSLEKITLFQ